MMDLILVGGGLANALLAWRLRQLQPELKFLVLEQGINLGGNHTWSFFQHDLTPKQHCWLGPFVVYQWPRYRVRYPDYERVLETPYYSITSECLHQVMMREMPECIRLNAKVEEVAAQHVTVNGEVIRAKAVIDARGYQSSPHIRLAYQKFVGQEVELTGPHGLSEPIIMDACVGQIDGYRFIYVLPLTERRLLIEDTYYSTSFSLDETSIRQRIQEYAAKHGWEIANLLRSEQGVLPIVLSGDIDAFWQEKPLDIPCAGLRAGLFHPMTGYSLPCAVELADQLASTSLTDPIIMAEHVRNHAKAMWRSQRYLRMLVRMLFLAGRPAERYRILQRFYRLPRPLIERFYAGKLTMSDQFRILAGKPPVPIPSAISAMLSFRKESS